MRNQRSFIKLKTFQPQRYFTVTSKLITNIKNMYEITTFNYKVTECCFLDLIRLYTGYFLNMNFKMTLIVTPNSRKVVLSCNLCLKLESSTLIR